MNILRRILHLCFQGLTNQKHFDTSRHPIGNGRHRDLRAFGTRAHGDQRRTTFQVQRVGTFIVKCDTQEEIDYYWERLTSEGGEEGMCGWLKDKYSLSWQIVPAAMDHMMQQKDPEKLARVTQANHIHIQRRVSTI